MPSLIFCAFRLSGTYSPTARYLFYTLTLLCTVSRRATWLIGGTLAGSLLFSSIAAAHSFPLLARPSAGGVDLDVFAVFTICSVGALAAGPMLKWSSVVREAEAAVRTVVAVWMVWCFVGGIVAGVAMRRELGKIGSSAVEACTGVGTDMREGQTPEVVSLLPWRETLRKWGLAVMVLSGLIGILGFLLGMVNRRRILVAEFKVKSSDEFESLGGSVQKKRPREARKGSVLGFLAPMTVRLSLVLAIVQVGVMERFMIGPKPMPTVETMKAVGAWGPLVAVGMGLIVGLMKAILSKDERKPAEAVLVEELPVKPATEGPWWAVLESMWETLQDATKWILRIGVMRRREFGLDVKTGLSVSGSK